MILLTIIPTIPQTCAAVQNPRPPYARGSAWMYPIAFLRLDSAIIPRITPTPQKLRMIAKIPQIIAAIACGAGGGGICGKYPGGTCCGGGGDVGEILLLVIRTPQNVGAAKSFSLNSATPPNVLRMGLLIVQLQRLLLQKQA